MAETCEHVRISASIPGHSHTCKGTHQDGMHKCSEPWCRRWFA